MINNKESTLAGGTDYKEPVIPYEIKISLDVLSNMRKRGVDLLNYLSKDFSIEKTKEYIKLVDDWELTNDFK